MSGNPFGRTVSGQIDPNIFQQMLNTEQAAVEAQSKSATLAGLDLANANASNLRDARLHVGGGDAQAIARLFDQDAGIRKTGLNGYNQSMIDAAVERTGYDPNTVRAAYLEGGSPIGEQIDFVNQAALNAGQMKIADAFSNVGGTGTGTGTGAGGIGFSKMNPETLDTNSDVGQRMLAHVSDNFERRGIATAWIGSDDKRVSRESLELLNAANEVSLKTGVPAALWVERYLAALPDDINHDGNVDNWRQLWASVVRDYTKLDEAGQTGAAVAKSRAGIPNADYVRRVNAGISTEGVPQYAIAPQSSLMQQQPTGSKADLLYDQNIQGRGQAQLKTPTKTTRIGTTQLPEILTGLGDTSREQGMKIASQGIDQYFGDMLGQWKAETKKSQADYDLADSIPKENMTTAFKPTQFSGSEFFIGQTKKTDYTTDDKARVESLRNGVAERESALRASLVGAMNDPNNESYQQVFKQLLSNGFTDVHAAAFIEAAIEDKLNHRYH